MSICHCASSSEAGWKPLCGKEDADQAISCRYLDDKVAYLADITCMACVRAISLEAETAVHKCRKVLGPEHVEAVASYDDKQFLGVPMRGWAEPDDDLVQLRINGECSWLTREDARRLAAMLMASSHGQNIFLSKATP